tara:strand:- start:1441 stop:2043 length:603 start_codon:yes stop_codon:yes gene_type:complete
MNGSLFNEVMGIINNWDPDDDSFTDEKDYQDDLISFLREKLNEKQPIGIGTQKRIKVQSESGRHLCDIVVNEEIGIELKKDLKLSEVDRLKGQIDRFKKQYKDLIIVVVGEHNPDNHEELIEFVDDIKDTSPLGMGQGLNIEIIDQSFKYTDEDDDEEDGGEEVGEDITEEDDKEEYNPVTGEKLPKGYTRDHLGRLVRK